jgi:hypothetical protein
MVKTASDSNDWMVFIMINKRYPKFTEQHLLQTTFAYMERDMCVHVHVCTRVCVNKGIYTER